MKGATLPAMCKGPHPMRKGSHPMPCKRGCHRHVASATAVTEQARCGFLACSQLTVCLAIVVMIE